jgi:hypothetical protein
MEVSPLARGARTPIRSITERPSLSPSSHTPTPLSSPCGSLSLAGDVWAYHVPYPCPSGLGCACSPVVRHLRQGMGESLDLTTYLLVPASQPLWLVGSHDV